MAGRTDWAALLGESGKAYPFKFYPLNLTLRGFPKFPNEAGVYAFAKKKHDNDIGGPYYDDLYVGQTESFEDRLVEGHSHWECAEKHGCNSIGIHGMPESSLMIEKKLDKDIIVDISLSS